MLDAQAGMLSLKQYNAKKMNANALSKRERIVSGRVNM